MLTSALSLLAGDSIMESRATIELPKLSKRGDDTNSLCSPMS
jgi:hypothetical protein